MKQGSLFQRVRWRPIVIITIVALAIMGLLSSQAIRQRLAEIMAQRDYLNGRCTKSYWSPDQTQFVLRSGCPSLDLIDLTVYSLDGTMLYKLPSHYEGDWFWSPDGSYVAVTTCVGTHTDVARVYTVFDTSSWKKLCTAGSGAGLICADFDRTCSLPLKGGRTWLLSGSTDFFSTQLYTSSCDNAGNCVTESH